MTWLDGRHRGRLFCCSTVSSADEVKISLTVAVLTNPQRGCMPGRADSHTAKPKRNSCGRERTTGRHEQLLQRLQLHRYQLQPSAGSALTSPIPLHLLIKRQTIANLELGMKIGFANVCLWVLLLVRGPRARKTSKG
ncbi:hypothetical protein GALMADRAFT_232059 [Galerina marginata CBS 339.88]|uniref:Uncharacterized protein n=1 Tax=Galerina marginata (strain CBS 339.88) TaxID=685588 RepID=A0A067SBR2_GALM3|nr:hypothetical protein GALMADRAFT_232059 [Galerina marginata CBS 339.88]